MRILSPDSSQSLHKYGTNTYIYEDSGGLKIGVENNTNIVFYDRTAGRQISLFNPIGATELYYNGTKQLETHSNGVSIVGNLSAVDMSSTGTMTTNNLNVSGTMTAPHFNAQYADLAEKYTIKDDNIDVGQVVVISDDVAFDGETSKLIGSNRILGVVSENPAFIMNTELTDGVLIALKGRVKCIVQGPVNKGEPLITNYDGTAISFRAMENPPFGSLLGRANEFIMAKEQRKIEIII